jgi:3-deoxy-D-manno-octulosonate 8-phosphate phosphatase (KDO 8-P phosphatase)
MKNFKEKLRAIKLLVLDVDGVLTDGMVICFENGDQIRNMNIKDGYALQLAVKTGLRILIISGGKSQGVLNRLNKLGIEDVMMGAQTKLPLLEAFCVDSKYHSEEVLFMGDDIPDLHCMKWAGTAACPADAANEIKEISDYVSRFQGGKGCVRDVIEQLLKVQGKWMQQEAFSW